MILEKRIIVPVAVLAATFVALLTISLAANSGTAHAIGAPIIIDEPFGCSFAADADASGFAEGVSDLSIFEPYINPAVGDLAPGSLLVKIRSNGLVTVRCEFNVEELDRLEVEPRHTIVRPMTCVDPTNNPSDHGVAVLTKSGKLHTFCIWFPSGPA